MRKLLREHLMRRVQYCVSREKEATFFCEKIQQKKEAHAKRNAEIVKAKATGKIKKKWFDREKGMEKVYYSVHFQYLIKHKNDVYLEEEMEERVAHVYKDELVLDQEILQEGSFHIPENAVPSTSDKYDEERQTFIYDRLKAVKYAEVWWNDFNPAFEKFDVDCTNYISQCLHAGNAPMVGYPNRSRGWWMKNGSWSFSWTVANGLRWYLPGAKRGLRGKEVGTPQELEEGDVIFYDFQGDGRFDHSTFVTAKDADGMPLVNAHTSNSRMRYWAYEDSTAYTPNIKYKFFHIIDDRSN